MPGDPPKSDTFDELVFRQELNEVYLLLDFISGHPDKHLSGLDGRIPDPDAEPSSKTMLGSMQVIAKVSDIRYPPAASPHTRSRDAAFLLGVKDVLNGLTYPARGMTIAYTTMFLEKGPKDGASRFEAARSAFPSLERSATVLRTSYRIIANGGIAIAFVAALLLWYVTYGVQVAARFDEAKRNDAAAAARVYEQTSRERSSGENTPDITQTCRIGTPIGKEDRTPAMQQACAEYAYRHALLCTAIQDVSAFSQHWVFSISGHFLPIHPFERSTRCGEPPPGTAGPDARENPQALTGLGRQEDAQSVAGVLAVMANYLLPILFGIVGTIAALVRSIQDKVTASLLAPRDRALLLLRLPLGIMAGICVGLFLSPASAAAQNPGSIGSFTVSASGIAFLAGYGAEVFFRALDLVAERVFSLESPPRRGARPASG